MERREKVKSSEKNCIIYVACSAFLGVLIILINKKKLPSKCLCIFFKRWSNYLY